MRQGGEGLRKTRQESDGGTGKREDAQQGKPVGSMSVTGIHREKYSVNGKKRI